VCSDKSITGFQIKKFVFLVRLFIGPEDVRIRAGRGASSNWVTFLAAQTGKSDKNIYKTNFMTLVRMRIIPSSDRRLSAKLVPTFADGGCRVVSATDLHGLILGL
jgi:hypothetical protein